MSDVPLPPSDDVTLNKSKAEYDIMEKKPLAMEVLMWNCPQADHKAIAHHLAPFLASRTNGNGYIGDYEIGLHHFGQISYDHDTGTKGTFVTVVPEDFYLWHINPARGSNTFDAAIDVGGDVLKFRLLVKPYEHTVKTIKIDTDNWARIILPHGCTYPDHILEEMVKAHAGKSNLKITDFRKEKNHDTGGDASSVRFEFDYMTDHIPNLKDFATIKLGEYGTRNIKVGPIFAKNFNLSTTTQHVTE